MGYPRVPRIKTVALTVLPRINMVQPTDDGHLERAFFSKITWAWADTADKLS
jgi:hypothetical protein